MPYIKTLALSNFRSFVDDGIRDPTPAVPHNVNAPYEHQLELSQGMTLVHGYNGTGKTALVEAMKLALTGNSEPCAVLITEPRINATDKVVARLNMALGQGDTPQRNVEWELGPKSTSSSFTFGTNEIAGSKESGRNKNVKKITSTLGISPGVWDHVVMVSQEHSLWPFMTDGQVREIFNEIHSLTDKVEEEYKLRLKVKKLAEDEPKKLQNMQRAKPRHDEYKSENEKYKDDCHKLSTMNTKYKELSAELNVKANELEILKQTRTFMEAIETSENFLSNFNLSKHDYETLDANAIKRQIVATENQIKQSGDEIKKLDREQSGLETEIQNLNITLGSIREKIKTSENADSEIFNLLGELGISRNSDFEVNRTQIETLASSKSERNALHELKQNELKRLEDVKRARKAEGFQTIPIAVWSIFQKYLGQNKERIQDLNMKKRQLNTNMTIREQLQNTDQEILRLEKLSSKIEAYDEIISKLPQACQQCSSNDSTIFKTIQNLIEKAKSNLTPNYNITSLTESKETLLELLKDEASVEPLLKFQQEINIAAKITENPESSTSQNFTMEDSGFGASGISELSHMSDPDRASNVSRKRRFSSLEDSTLSHDEYGSPIQNPEFQKTVEQHEAQIKDLVETKIRPLEEEIRNVDRIKTQINEKRKLLFSDCGANGVNQEESCASEIKKYESFKNANASKIVKLRKTRDDLNKTKNQQSIKLKCYEENHKLCASQANLSALLAANYASEQTLQEVKNLETSLGLRLKEAQSLRSSTKIEISKLEGSSNLRSSKLPGLKQDSDDYLMLKKEYEDMVDELELSKRDADNLEKIITSTHEVELVRINEVIQRYWTELYPHTDFIPRMILKALPVPKSKTIKRIEYDYHFVLCPPARELKMRGASSSGEKCLTSVIIRCALAELYATNCPIFAFDAPDAGLDPDVVNRLLKLFQRLLDSGKQLVITSADLGFLERNKRELENPFPHLYYSLHKANGRSIIAQPVQD